MLLFDSVSVVIPVFNAERTLDELIHRIDRVLKNYSFYEIILVDDGSTDHSVDICKMLIQRYPQCRLISLFKNFGQISAIMAGLRCAQSEFVVVLDDDLQNIPEEIPKLIQELQRGRDFVFAIPEAQVNSGVRKWGSLLNKKMTELAFDKPKDIYPSSFLAMNHRLLSQVLEYEGPYPYLSGLIFRVTKNGINVRVKWQERVHGKSTYTFRKLISLWLNGFTNFSILPLRVASLVGVIFSMLGAGCLLAFVIQHLLVKSYGTGWLSVFGMIILTSGIQLIALGMIGEYVGRIFLFLNKSPQYAIREKINCNDGLKVSVRNVKVEIAG